MLQHAFWPCVHQCHLSSRRPALASTSCRSSELSGEAQLVELFATHNVVILAIGNLGEKSSLQLNRFFFVLRTLVLQSSHVKYFRKNMGDFFFEIRFFSLPHAVRWGIDWCYSPEPEGCWQVDHGADGGWNPDATTFIARDHHWDQTCNSVVFEKAIWEVEDLREKVGSFHQVPLGPQLNTSRWGLERWFCFQAVEIQS